MKKYNVKTTHKKTFWRCGIEFGAEFKTVELTEEQASIITSEPMLFCVEVPAESASQKKTNKESGE